MSITNYWSLLKLISIKSVMPSNHLMLCHPLLLLASIFPSIGVFSNESILPIRWPKCWSFSFSISPSSEYSGLIYFRMDWLDLLAVQGTLKSLLQHHSSKASIGSSQIGIAGVNTDILGISELKCTGISEFNSDDHDIYHCGEESLRRSGVAILAKKRVHNAVRGYNLKNDRMISVHFQGKPFNIMVIQVCVLTSNA